MAGKVEFPRVFAYHEALRLEGRLKGQDTFTRGEIQKHHVAKLAASEMYPPLIIGMTADVLQKRIDQVLPVLPMDKWPAETLKQLVQRSSPESLEDPLQFFDICWPYHATGEQPLTFNPMAPRMRDLPSVLLRPTEVAVARFVRDFFATHMQRGEKGVPMIMKMAEVVSGAFLPDDAADDIKTFKSDVHATAGMVQDGLYTSSQVEGLLSLQRRAKVGSDTVSARMIRVSHLMYPFAAHAQLGFSGPVCCGLGRQQTGADRACNKMSIIMMRVSLERARLHL